MRMALPSKLIAACLPLALVAACNADASTPAEVPEFDSGRAWRDLVHMVQLGPRPSGSAAIEQNRVFIESELSAVGLSPQREAFTAQTAVGPIEMCNIYADLEGTRKDGEKAPLVILCTHFDTWRLDSDFVGANDGGSSTAVMLELARALQASAPHALSYRFLFVDGEEETREWSSMAGKDNTYGSRAHAERLLTSADYKRTQAALVIDLVGDKDLQFWRDQNSDPKLLKVFFDAARRQGLGQHVDGTRQAVKDDHLSFMAIGIISADLIDLDYGPNNSFWHTTADTLDNCSQASLNVTGTIVLAGLAELERQAR
jgi:glutaminyl-peptide cyclotransferase